MVLLGAAVGLVLLLGIAYWWFSRSVTPETPAVAAAAAPAPPPRKTAAEVFAEAQLAFADGDDARTLEILRTLSAADQNSLPPESCRALQSLQQTLALSAIDRLPDNLAKGLKGDIGRLRSAVLAAAGQEAAVPEALRPDLERARGMVDLYDQIEAAAGRKAHAEVLDRFAVLTQQLPNATDPRHLRDQAADAVEEEAEAIAREGRYQEAVEHLGPVQRSWPARPASRRGSTATSVRSGTRRRRSSSSAELPNYEKRHRPDEALDKMSGVTPTPHLAAEFAEVRRRLEEQLAQSTAGAAGRAARRLSPRLRPRRPWSSASASPTTTRCAR